MDEQYSVLLTRHQELQVRCKGLEEIIKDQQHENQLLRRQQAFPYLPDCG